MWPRPTDRPSMIRNGSAKPSHRSSRLAAWPTGIRETAGSCATIGGGVSSMAMTGVVKDELSRLSVMKPCCRKSEVSTLLRFAGGLHIVSGRIVIEAELDTGAAARRLRRDLSEVFGHTSDVVVLAPSALRKGNRYVVRVFRDGESLARQTGLIDNNGRPVRGLPRHVVAGGSCDAAAAGGGGGPGHRAR